MECDALRVDQLRRVDHFSGHHRYRRSVIKFLAGGLLLAGCGGSGASTAGSLAPASVGAGGRLPGESTNDFYQRLINDCMAPYGYPYTMANGFVDGGKPSNFRVYDVDPVIQKQQAVCITQASQGIGAQKLTPTQLKANWTFQTEVMRCLIDKGYDIGTLVSLEEFVAAGGAVDVATKLSEFGGLEQPDSAADMDACVASAS